MRITKRFTALIAAFTVATSLGLASLGIIGGGLASAQGTPTSKADCANWRDYGFRNKGACVSFVARATPHGYGGNGGNHGGGDIGSIGKIIRQVLDAFIQVIRIIFGNLF